jgi:murein DD-endopeptidase MepM/ murein hydrolase activator NlpD
MSFARRSWPPLFAGLERWFMSLREGAPEAGLPTSHYFLSLSRGDAIRTIMVRRENLWAIAAITALLFAWTAVVTAYLAFHDDLMRTLVARQSEVASEMAKAYENRLAEARTRLGEAASLRALDRNKFEAKLADLISRQARLEKRGAIVAALAAETEGRNPPPLKPRRSAAFPSAADALGAIQSLGPPTPAGADAGAARAYAPLPGPGIEPRAVKPHPVDEPGETLSMPAGEAQLAPPGPAADDLDGAARFAIVGGSLDRIDGGQMKALAAIDRTAARLASRDSAIVARTGLDPAKLVPPHGEGGVGGPFIPAEVDPGDPAFNQALTRVARDVAGAEQLSALMPFVPLRMPLTGDASLTSPFGYRADPFLGRLALHPGVDLIEAYGDEIHATAAGRVTHAGPMGGYGIMVEIDHGNGLVTRYAHMSKALVAEGEDVVQGAVLGRLGSTGRSTGPHLHYEVRVDGEPVDPERYLRAGAELTTAE